jgi:hypothetical protein
MFVPFMLTKDRRPNRAWTQREGFITRDLTMPYRDWSKFDSLAQLRFVSDRPRKIHTSNVIPIDPAFLRRQAT